MHGWDSNTPLEETLGTLDDLVARGVRSAISDSPTRFMASGYRDYGAGAFWGWKK